MGELILSGIFLLFSIFTFIQAGKLPESSYEQLGPGTFPEIITFIMGILSLILFIKNLKNLKTIKYTSKKMNIEFLSEYNLVIIIFIIFFIYIISMNYIGFRISTFLFLVTSQWIIGPKERKYVPVILCISIAITLGSYYFFENYLSVLFPSGIFFE